MAALQGVWLSTGFDLGEFFGQALAKADPEGDVQLFYPEEVPDPAAIRFALCWRPAAGAFDPYPNLALAMSVAAGVDGLVDHPGLAPAIPVARVRDPNQSSQMAGYVAHEVLHRERAFGQMAENAARGRWQRIPLRAPGSTTIAVLGHGSMGRAVVLALKTLGFALRVACRSAPAEPLEGVNYLTGEEAIAQAVTGADYIVNVLPLTAQTRDVLNAALFARLKPGAWLIQIGRGEHLVEEDLIPALDAGQLAGATLDVVRQEPLAPDHPFWSYPRLRITPHVASDALPEVVAEQVLTTLRALRDGQPLDLAVDRGRGY